MIASMLTSLEIAAAAISMSSASSSNSSHSSLPSSGSTSSTCRKSWPDWCCTVARATAAPRQTVCSTASRTRRGMSNRQAATVLPQAFTDPVAVAAVAWRVWTCDSRNERAKDIKSKNVKRRGRYMRGVTHRKPWSRRR